MTQTDLDVNHYLCPKGGDYCHHLVPHPVGSQIFEHRCSFCGKSERELREEVLAGMGDLHPLFT